MTEIKNNIEITEEFINVKKIISGKNPKLARYIPGFVYAWLKKTLHLQEVNGAIYRNRDHFGLDFVDDILREFGANITVEGQENIPTEGKIIVASNHPLGGLDGMALMQAVGKVRKDIIFPVNDFLMYLPGLRVLFVPVNKTGSNAQNLQIIKDTFSTEKALLYFPAGLCSRKINGKITDLEWEKTFITKAKENKRDIVPTYIEGANTQFFYNLSNWRKKLGIKANIEMLYLVDEMYKQRTKKIHIKFGKPIPYQFFDQSKTDKQWAEYMKNYVYQMKK